MFLLIINCSLICWFHLTNQHTAGLKSHMLANLAWRWGSQVDTSGGTSLQPTTSPLSTIHCCTLLMPASFKQMLALTDSSLVPLSYQSVLCSPLPRLLAFPVSVSFWDHSNLTHYSTHTLAHLIALPLFLSHRNPCLPCLSKHWLSATYNLYE